MADTKNYDFYPFAGVPTFLRAPLVTPENRLDEKPFSIGVLGIPFDEACAYSPGSRFGPRGIREHSLRVSNMGVYDHKEKRAYLYEEFQRKSILDFGDVNIIPCDIEGNFQRITDAVHRIIDKDALVISFGGDHSVTYPIVRAFSEKPVHVIQFDAHADYLPISPGYENTNGHPMSQIARMDHVKSLTQVGIRSVREFSFLDSIADGNRVIGMDEFHEIGPQGVADSIPAGEPVYVTIDIDAYDMSLCPGCGSAEPNGFLYAELRDTLAAVARHNPVLGFDFVEVAPLIDIRTDLTSYIAMLTVMEFLGKICDQPHWKKRYE